ALDDDNSTKFTDIIGELASHSQILVITHNHETMHCADNLFGITTSQKGDSEVLQLALKQATELIEA
ncbi:chromosome segregation protein SMC, partial [Candidatus Saccharibacteria bacterium]|nr:chromosome segregation protein SMC [Candidatus Saccharibacteria bacterium]